jgi:SAM-dependent methyltransferase
MKGVTLYSGLSQFYFRHLLKQIVKIGRLNRPDIIILDFGCGRGELKRMIDGGGRVIGYDIIPELSDVSDWRVVDFNVLVANEVFYSFSEGALESLLRELRQKNPALELVTGISRQGMLNNIGKYLLGRPDAHSATKIGPKKELEILERHCRVIRHKNVLNLAHVHALAFR